MRAISFLGNFFKEKGIYIFKLRFSLRNCQILSLFKVILLQIHFGSGTARTRDDFFRIRIRNDFSGSVSGSCLNF
jgi:hypothetical protein